MAGWVTGVNYSPKFWLTTTNRGHPVRFFVDGADVERIGELVASGLFDGVTTKRSLIARHG